VRILVCVKRVPITGGKIVLTDDAQAIRTLHLGFTISPHEECGVEEAVRIVEAHGGESVVLTLGPPDAAAQLRDMLARLRRVTDLPLCVGFGVSRPEHVRELKEIADGVIVGSALVRKLEAAGTPDGRAKALADIRNTIAELSAALG